MNHPDYRSYERAQITDLVSRYAFDAVFYDMIFWPIICACEHCRARYRQESGREFPERIDWTQRDWCDFQAARERWAADFAADLARLTKEVRPGVDVYHNLAPGLQDWTLAQPLWGARHDDFVGGDLYGDELEQLVVSKLTLNLTENRPAEFMTSRCVSLADHVRLKPYERMRMQALAATACSAAFLFIDAIDPQGTIQPEVYERVGRVYAETARYEPYLGGEPVEDVAVYFSVDSQMDHAINGAPIYEPQMPSHRYPHLDAVRGVCRVLQRAHIPFGVITAKQLPDLDRYRVVVLSNVPRMSSEEAEAFRAYVARGGRLYASRFTSLVETEGTRHSDFMLADVFGVHFDGEEDGRMIYLRPVNEDLKACVAPQEYVSQEVVTGMRLTVPPLTAVPRVRQGSGTPLAMLTLPFGYPAPGNVGDHAWASIHSSPPWEDTDVPVLVENVFGSGRAIYSAAEIESVDAEVNERLVIGIIRRLLDGPFSFEVQTHPVVWTSATNDVERCRIALSLLNYPSDLPAVAVPARIRLRPPSGTRITSLSLAPDCSQLRYDTEEDGAVTASIGAVDPLVLVVATYA
jgi:hypothetical protein